MFQTLKTYSTATKNEVCVETSMLSESICFHNSLFQSYRHWSQHFWSSETHYRATQQCFNACVTSILIHNTILQSHNCWTTLWSFLFLPLYSPMWNLNGFCRSSSFNLTQPQRQMCRMHCMFLYVVSLLCSWCLTLWFLRWSSGMRHKYFSNLLWSILNYTSENLSLVAPVSYKSSPQVKDV